MVYIMNCCFIFLIHNYTHMHTHTFNMHTHNTHLHNAYTFTVATGDLLPKEENFNEVAAIKSRTPIPHGATPTIARQTPQPYAIQSLPSG